MTLRRACWRGWLAAAMCVGLAGAGTLTLGRAASGSSGAPAASATAAASAVAGSRPELPAAVAGRGDGEPSAVAAFSGHGRHRGHRAFVADANGSQAQQPAGPPAGAPPPAMTRGPRSAFTQPAWRGVLETRWQQRLAALTELSLAYHDAAEAPAGEDAAGSQVRSEQLHQLLRKAVAARRALCDTEEALARLSAGSYGRCEQCSATIPPALLALEPETRYCEGCFRAPPA